MILASKIIKTGFSVSRFIGKRKPIVGRFFAKASGLISLMMALLMIFSLLNFLNIDLYLSDYYYITFDLDNSILFLDFSTNFKIECGLPLVKEEKYYVNVDTNKLVILNENKGKSGIYQ